MSEITHQLELISLHIPKTAGTSFRHTLKAVYGDVQAQRFDLEKGVIRIEEQLFQGSQLPTATKAIHGHFNYRDLEGRLKNIRKVPTITWLRDPVERVLSNFFYLEKRLKELLDEPGNNLDILSKMQRSLLEFSRAEVNRNRMTRFLHGLPLDAFAFIGIAEHYEEDLAALAAQLGWSEYPRYRHNTSERPEVVGEEVKGIIRKFNAADQTLYEAALELREKRMGS